MTARTDSVAMVDIQNLWTVFHSGGVDHVVHKELNLRIERGQVLALVGGSGSGKTSLLRQMLGLDTPTRGQIFVGGQPVARLGGAGATSRVGMLFQHGALFSAFSVLENIAFALRELKTLPNDLIRDVAMVKLQMVGLSAQDAYKMPADLSGGMVKRVALARALVMDPPLLLLDEPTAGLDPESADGFCALLRNLCHELSLTVVMVTHDLDTLHDLCTHVAVLADQRVVICGTPEEVMANPHPFIQHFFLGVRGQRAMGLVPVTPMSQADSVNRL